MTFETDFSLTDLNMTGPPFRGIVWLFNLSDIVLYTPYGSLVSPAYRKRISLNTTSGWLELRDLTVGDSGVYTVDITTRTDLQVNGSTGLNVYGELGPATLPTFTFLLTFTHFACSVWNDLVCLILLLNLLL